MTLHPGMRNHQRFADDVPDAFLRFCERRLKARSVDNRATMKGKGIERDPDGPRHLRSGAVGVDAGVHLRPDLWRVYRHVRR